MDDAYPPILPPPPSARIALWAMLNALWFGLVSAVTRRVRRAVRAARRTVLSSVAQTAGGPPPEPGSIAAMAREGRFSSLLGRLARDRLAHFTPPPHFVGPRDDRPTVVERPPAR